MGEVDESKREQDWYFEGVEAKAAGSLANITPR